MTRDASGVSRTTRARFARVLTSSVFAETVAPFRIPTRTSYRLVQRPIALGSPVDGWAESERGGALAFTWSIRDASTARGRAQRANDRERAGAFEQSKRDIDQ